MIQGNIEQVVQAEARRPSYKAAQESLGESRDHTRLAKDRQEIMASLELSDIHSMMSIQADQQIRGDISWLYTHEGDDALKVIHEVIASAWRKTKDVDEVKEPIFEGKP